MVADNRVVQLSACAADYARALANPFDGPLACIPDFPALFSSRQRMWAKGSFSTGTAGFGFVTLSPSLASVSDATCGIFTTSAYTAAAVTNTATTGATAYSTNSQYLTADIGAGTQVAQYRVVAAGLRVRYRGTELNRGGTRYAFADPTHTSVNLLTVTTLLAEPEALEMNMDRQWVNVLYRPVFNTETQYSSDTTIIPQCMLVAVQAADAATSLSFEWQSYVVVEYQGRNIKGMIPSHSDPTGFSACNASALTSQALRPNQMTSEARENDILDQVAHYIGKSVSQVLDLTNRMESAAVSGMRTVQSSKKIWSNLSTVGEMAAPLLSMVV